VLRRAALRLNFQRPNEEARFAVFQRLVHGTSATETQLQELVKLTARKPQYTFSDLTDRIARLALRRSWKANQPFGVAALKAAIAEIEPSPLMAAS
jgi:SpoVK/Ycf46/Vps4 family AAA+-type ATPase